jgi:hypothetical protein
MHEKLRIKLKNFKNNTIRGMLTRHLRPIMPTCQSQKDCIGKVEIKLRDKTFHKVDLVVRKKARSNQKWFDYEKGLAEIKT